MVLLCIMSNFIKGEFLKQYYFYDDLEIILLEMTKFTPHGHFLLKGKKKE